MYRRNIHEVYRRVIFNKIRQKTIINFKTIKIDHFSMRKIQKHLKKISRLSNLTNYKKLCKIATIIIIIIRNHKKIEESRRKLTASLKPKLGKINKG